MHTYMYMRTFIGHVQNEKDGFTVTKNNQKPNQLRYDASLWFTMHHYGLNVYANNESI